MHRYYGNLIFIIHGEPVITTDNGVISLTTVISVNSVVRETIGNRLVVLLLETCVTSNVQPFLQ